jgi:hypothetical protein
MIKYGDLKPRFGGFFIGTISSYSFQSFYSFKPFEGWKL